MFNRPRKSARTVGHHRHVLERLEERRLLSATLSVSQTLMAFNAVKSTTSPTETLTLTNTGADPLTLGSSAFSIVNDPSNATADAARFAMTNSSSAPASLGSGASFVLNLDYNATAVGVNSAFLDITTNDPTTPTHVVALRGLGTAGIGGTNQPSLDRILQTYEIPDNVGEPNAANAIYPNPPGAGSQEVTMQQLVKAGTGPVTIQVLASFTAAGDPPFILGTYTPGSPANRTELFHTLSTEYQSVYVQPQGNTSFDPGSAPFGFYFVSNFKDNGQNRLGFTEDALNTFDTTNDRKFRFFPMETSSGTVVPNTYIMTTTEFNAPAGYDFTNIVAVVSNVKAATITTPLLSARDTTPLPYSNTIVFNRITNQNTTVGDTVHDTDVLEVANTGGAPLVVSSYSLSSAWTLVSPPSFPLTLAPGAYVNLTIKFVANSLPTVPYNETNTPENPTDGGVYNGTLTLNSNDPARSTDSFALAGYWQYHSEDNEEPSLQSIVNLMAGYTTVINSSPISELTEPSTTTPTYYGDEVVSTYWEEADPTDGVSVFDVAGWHTQGNTATVSWYSQGSPSSQHTLFVTNSDSGQTLMPALESTSDTTNFLTSTAFGLKVDYDYTDDSLNTNGAGDRNGDGHHFRFFPLITAAGVTVPNTYIVAMDYGTADENYDFQDNVFIVSNIRPTAVPAAPTGVTASVSSSGVTLQWLPVADSTLKGYNVYSSIAPTTGYSLLTSSPITATSYTDANPAAGTTVYYHITAVDASTGKESLPTETSINTSGTPVTGLQSIDIGASPSGSTTVVTAGSAYNVTAGGPGVTGNADGFRYIYQQETGDFDVYAQVKSLTVAGNYSTAGIMARTSLSTTSANVYMSASPVNYRFKTRATDGAAETLVVGANDTFPNVWVRLQRVGNTFNGYSSTDGVNWTLVSTTSLSLASTLYLGLAVASNVTTTTTTAQLAGYASTPIGPITKPDSYTVAAGASMQLAVLSNDTDSTGTIVPSSVAIATEPNDGGTVVVNSNGTITYTPAAGFSGVENFSYTVSDSNGVTSQSALVSVTVTPPAGSAPTAVADAVSVVEGNSAIINVLANDLVAAGDSINVASVLIATNPTQGGTAVANANGTITYTPAAGFTGTDIFTYTVADTAGLVSQPATVTVTVSASNVGPVAVADSASATAGQAVAINVLANDTDSNGTIDPTTVAIAIAPSEGGTVAVNPTSGVITYTPPADFAGTDTFSYTVKDTAGNISNAAVVTITVTNNPLAAAVAASTSVNAATVINVLSSVVSGVALNPATVTIATAPTHGTATVNADGTITFTPATGFIGADSFTYAVANTNGLESNVATVNVNVGVELIAPVGSKSLTYTDASGTVATVIIARGSATLLFAGDASETVGRNGAITISGSNVTISNIALTGTNAASALAIRTRGGLITLGGITDSNVIGSIVAATANLTGTLNVAGLTTLQLAQMNNAQLTVGAGLPAVAITAGIVTGSSVTSSVPIRALRSTSWSNSGISAPTLASAAITGSFGTNLTLTGTGVDISALRVTGQLSGSWMLSGSVGSIVVGSVAADWTPAITGSLAGLTILSGGLPAIISVGRLGSLSVVGDITGTLTAAYANAISVRGNITATTLNFVGPDVGTIALNRLVVSGAMTGSTLNAAGDIAALSVGSLTDSSIFAGVNNSVTLDTAATANIGDNTIRSLRVVRAFAGSSILAHTINAAALGSVDISNNGSHEGLAAAVYKSVSGVFSGQVGRFGPAQLTSAAALLQYRQKLGINFSDFEIVFAD